MSPFKLECKEVEWWTVYEIGQRLGSKFDQDDRVFLAGDAIHTHSPKAGQGMNVSMMDAYNLGWKLHHCLRGYAKASLLSTYHRERYTTAKRLIEVDKTLVPLFSAKGQAGTMEAFGKVWKEFKLFTSGKTVLYESILCPPPTAEAEVLAKNIKVGSHLESYWVVNFATYDTIFADDVAYHQPAGQAYNGYGIDRKTGCIVVLRPDQYVAGLFHIDHPERIGSYFQSFMNVHAS
ncbi:hypothetical protein BT69DRAFT_1346163 [Atractiella rhizophila]|nr:hypothetical protein BT69DRAFT_1346163 [Atractiella rhizophila]